MAIGESDITKLTRLDRLTSIRFVAALFVVVTHLATLYSNVHFQNVASRFAYAVNYFFLLSGFVLTWSHKRGDKPWHFWRRRFARVYPLYILTWGVALYIIFGVFHRTQTTLATVSSAFLFQSWYNNPRIYYASNGVSWSLADEAFFYLLFPLLFFLLIRANRKVRWAVVVLSFAASVCAPLTLHVWSTPTVAWFIFIFPVTRLFEFIIGMVLALEFRDGWHPKIPAIAVLVLIAGGLTLGYKLPFPQWRVYPLILPMAVMICWAVSKDLYGKKGLLNNRFFVRLGPWSYALYLGHSILLYLVEDKLSTYLTGSFQGILYGVDIVFVAVIGAGFLHEAWERPLEKLLRGQPPRTEFEQSPSEGLAVST